MKTIPALSYPLNVEWRHLVYYQYHKNWWYLLGAALYEWNRSERLLAAKVSVLLFNVNIPVDSKSALARLISKEGFQIMPVLFR